MAEIVICPEQFVFGLDIGTRSIVGTIGYMDNNGFHVVAMEVKEHDTRAMIDGQVHDIAVVGEEIKYVKEQLVNQLKKIVNVKKVEVLLNEPIKRELMLIKVANASQNRSDIMTAVDVFRASVIDYSPEAMCIEVTGTPSKIDAFVKLMQPFGILEMCRTGVVALDRGIETLLSK